MSSDKEDIADGLLNGVEAAKSPLPTRKSGRSRSKSIDPQSNLTVPMNFKEVANRRKSAILPAVRSILSGPDDEDIAKKRKEARRKSLANRRVSFAPEATLHTWDVIEYMRDATSTTSSSASSNNSLNSSTRRSPAQSPQSASTALPDPSLAVASPGRQPPSTPPEQVEAESEVITSSPGNQREAHQRKRRRSSTNTPDGVYSSSPISGSSSPATPSVEAESSDSDSDDGVDETETGMSMDLSEADVTVQSAASEEYAEDSPGSSARLDEALRLAARQAGTQGIDFDENGDASMEIAGDTVTNAFVPFARGQNHRDYTEHSEQDKENVDPFNPASKDDVPRRLSHITEMSEEDGMSMDMTRAVGGILQQSSHDESKQSSDDGTMDFTMVMPGSGIVNGTLLPDAKNRRASLKRRRSSAVQGTNTDETGSPAKRTTTSRRQSLRAARRRSSVAQVDDEASGDETMELTANLGAIQEEVSQQLLQEQDQHSTTKRLEVTPDRTIIQRRESTDTTFGDVPMDMTMVVGGGIARPAVDVQLGLLDGADEDLSMDVTMALGSIAPQGALRDISSTPVAKPTFEAQSQQWKFPTPERPTLVNAFSTPAQEVAGAPDNRSKATDSKSPKRKTPRTSLVPATPEAQKDNTPVSRSLRNSSARSAKASTNATLSEKSPLQGMLQVSTPTAVGVPDIVVVDTPVRTAQLVEAHELATVAQPSPKPKHTPKQPLPAPVRSPLAPKSDSRGNAAPPPKLSDSIKQLSTPRKQIKADPLKKVLAASTPKAIVKNPSKSASPLKGRSPRKSLSPRKRVRVTEEDKENAEVAQSEEDVEADSGPRIPLQDFLNLTGIQFMDLRTTKRRHTGFPGAKGASMFQEDEDESTGGDGMDSLERTVVAATVTVPNIEMYRHSCQEMNNYISSGRNLVQEMDEGVLAETPQLFLEYLQAPARERQIMDDQFRAMKAYARLESKGSWYQWRSQLLKDLTRGLDLKKSDMVDDQLKLENLEQLAGSTLDGLTEQKLRLKQELEGLQRRREERDSDKREELEEARGILSELNSTLADKQNELEALRKQLRQQSEAQEILQERKEEALGAIKEANRVRDECRGWSSEEVSVLQAQTKELEEQHHWSVRDVSASTSAVTLLYRHEVELFFHPLAFADARSPNASPAKAPHANQPISLRYIAHDKRTGTTKELSTTQRFFIQLLRAQLLALPQPTTTVSTLLRLISRGWETCTALSEGVAQLEDIGLTDVAILGDEVLGIKTAVVLPDVTTKVMVRFAVSVSVAEAEVVAKVQSNVKVVYGERYDEVKMTDFLKGLVGDEVMPKERMGVWADAVGDLRARLIKRGRKS